MLQTPLGLALPWLVPGAAHLGPKGFAEAADRTNGAPSLGTRFLGPPP